MSFSTLVPWKIVQNGRHGVRKYKLEGWDDAWKGFGSTFFGGSSQEAVQVGPGKKVGASKSRFYNFQLESSLNLIPLLKKIYHEPKNDQATAILKICLSFGQISH